MEVASSRSIQEVKEQDKVDEEVFKKVFIPRTLEEVPDFERDINSKQHGNELEIHYQAVTGLKDDLTGPLTKPSLLEEEEAQNDEEEAREDSENSSGSESDSEKDRSEHTQYTRQRGESADSRRARKKLVKEENREKRKQKMPKHIKKRKEKIAKQKHGRN
eukprot:XP_002599042.1 hypothetical protein BRAFLDRAFT_104262 [Branchiostoma floridae]